MDCGYWTKLIPAYLDGELAEDQARRMEEHLDACPACAREADAAQLLNEALATALEAQLPWAVGRATRQAFRDEASRPGLAAWWRGMTPALRSAACVLAVAGLAAGVFMGNAMHSYIQADSPPAAAVSVLGGDDTELVL